MTPAERRAAATNDMFFLCKRILARVESGPSHQGPTTEEDALRFEAISSALETALEAARHMNEGVD